MQIMNHLPHNQRANQFVQEIGELLINGFSQRSTHTAARQPATGQPGTGESLVGFGEYISAARAVLLYSQQEFALRLGMDDAQLIALEHGLLPRALITPYLLQRIAHLLEEEQEILVLILDGYGEKERKDGDTVASQIATNVVEPLRGSSGFMFRKRTSMPTGCTSGKIGLKKLWQECSDHSSLFQFVRQRLGRVDLLYNHLCNLLDFQRTSRLTIETVAYLYLVRLRMGIVTRTATVATVMLLVYWFSVSVTNPPFQIDSYPSHDISISDVSISNDEIAFADEPILATSVVPPSAIASAIGQQNHLPYRIVYSTNISREKIRARAYIEVDNNRFAAIQFLPNTPVNRSRCVSNNRFDLCPI